MFNLEEFKAGKAALDRNGNKYWFFDICEECNDNSKLIVRRDIGSITARFINGTSSLSQKVIGDLVKMESPADNLEVGELIMVWDRHYNDAKLRKFAEVNKEGEIGVYDLYESSLNIIYYSNCLTVEEYAKKYLKEIV